MKTATEPFFDRFRMALEAEAKRRGRVNVPRLYTYDKVETTMDVARQLLIEQEAKSADEFIVLAREQAAGRGRQARTWVSARDRGLYLTYVARQPLPLEQRQGFSLAIGVAVRRALSSFGAQVGLKWPNDILSAHRVDGVYRKVGGTLIELTERPHKSAALIGVGVNVYQQMFPPEVPGISIEQLTETPIDSAAVFGALCAELAEVNETFFSKGFSYFTDEWNRYSVVSGKRVQFTERGTLVEAIASRAAEDGGLVVVLPDGNKKTIYSGDVLIVE